MHLYTMKRILVCTDFSKTSDIVLKAADQLAQKNQGIVHLLHVSELALHLADLEEAESLNYRSLLLDSMKNSILEKMKAQLERCNSNAQPIIKSGKTESVILELTSGGDFDLIVMGHSLGPIASRILGSTAYKVISGTQIPLLLIKNELRLNKVVGLIDESRDMERIIVGTFDFYQNFECMDVEFISLHRGFVPPFTYAEEVLNLKEKIKEQVAHFSPVKAKPLIHVESIRELKLAPPLNEMLKKVNADVAVLKKYTDGNLKRIYIGSTSKNLLDIFDGNLLILPP